MGHGGVSLAADHNNGFEKNWSTVTGILFLNYIFINPETYLFQCFDLFLRYIIWIINSQKKI